LFDQRKGFFAGAVVDTYLMNAVIVDDHKIIVGRRDWIDTAFSYSMTKLDT
jgi:hypothetical protein